MSQVAGLQAGDTFSADRPRARGIRIRLNDCKQITGSTPQRRADGSNYQEYSSNHSRTSVRSTNKPRPPQERIAVSRVFLNAARLASRSSRGRPESASPQLPIRCVDHRRASLTDPRTLRQLTPESCPQCGGSDFNRFEPGNLHGSRGDGMNWLARCRSCDVLWQALALVDAVLTGTPPAWFSVESDPRTIPRAETHRPPASHCPDCQAGLTVSQQSECPHCGWLRYPTTARKRWGQVGGCPRCGFSYRWDDITCSHCGHPAKAEPGAAPDRAG